jgi:hypothetical protein
MLHATCLATILTIARHLKRCNDSCNLSRNAIARQVAWKIAPCNRALKIIVFRQFEECISIVCRYRLVKNLIWTMEIRRMLILKFCWAEMRFVLKFQSAIASLSKRRFWQHERWPEANLTLSTNQHSWHSLLTLLMSFVLSKTSLA